MKQSEYDVASESSGVSTTKTEMSGSQYPTTKTSKPDSILGRLRVINVNPSKEKRQEKGYSTVAPLLPDEVVVHDGGAVSPSSFTVHEEIEESLETTKLIIRKPSRFTFDLVPSMSESFDGNKSSDYVQDKTSDGFVCSNVSGLSILDDSKVQDSIPRKACNVAPRDTIDVAIMGPTKLDHRTRTNSTSATSAFSAGDVFCGSSSHVGVIKMTISNDPPAMNPTVDAPSSSDIALKGSPGAVEETPWFHMFASFWGKTSAAACAAA